MAEPKIVCRANLLLRSSKPTSAPPRNIRIEIWNKTRLLNIFCQLIKPLTISKQFFIVRSLSLNFCFMHLIVYEKKVYVYVYLYVSAMQDYNNTVQLLTQKPEYLKTLQLAVQKEEENLPNKQYLGWQWFDVETHPAKLMRLITSSIVKVNFKSNNSTNYLLKNRESVKRAIKRS